MAMTMSGEVQLAATREVVWEKLNDPAVLKACIPGCEDLESTDEGGFRATAKIKVGPVSARFKGKVVLSDLDPPNGYKIAGEGEGGVAGFAKCGAVVGLATIVVSGFVADRIGRRNLLAGTAAAIAAFSGFAPQLLNGGDVGELTFMILGFILLGLSFGQSSGAVAANFSKTYRYTGSALTSDLAWLFGAGFAPFVALLLSSHFGLMAAGAYLLSGAICTLLALAVSGRLRIHDQ